jgi:hypothetical protein
VALSRILRGEYGLPDRGHTEELRHARDHALGLGCVAWAAEISYVIRKHECALIAHILATHEAAHEDVP